jgi:hypothetical protein
LFRQQLEEKIAVAASSRELVQIFRDRIDSDGICSRGCILAASEELLMLQRLSDRIDFDGYEVLRVKDITSIDTEFDRKAFYKKALQAKSIERSGPPEVDLTDMRHLLFSVNEKFPLVVIAREERAPDQCEIGRIKLLTDTKYALKWISPSAIWEDDLQAYEVKDITRVTFDGEYENTLALVAGSSA